MSFFIFLIHLNYITKHSRVKTTQLYYCSFKWDDLIIILRYIHRWWRHYYITVHSCVTRRLCLDVSYFTVPHVFHITLQVWRCGHDHSEYIPQRTAEWDRYILWKYETTSAYEQWQQVGILHLLPIYIYSANVFSVTIYT